MLALYQGPGRLQYSIKWTAAGKLLYLLPWRAQNFLSCHCLAHEHCLINIWLVNCRFIWREGEINMDLGYHCLVWEDGYRVRFGKGVSG